MTADIAIKKATKPAFILGGLLLLLTGIAIASGNMQYGDKGSEITDKKLPMAAGLSIGILIILCSILILRKAFMSEPAA